ncbi:MAG: patatin-like phospholipase family protein [Candidatus Omnitrophota bacterium]
MKHKFLFLTIVIILAACCVSGCDSPRNAVPLDMQSKVVIPGMKGVRAFNNNTNSNIMRDSIRSIIQEPSNSFPKDKDGIKIYPVLALSGGAANGAYGAGLLNGWSESGSRPVFKAVTGISTGAIVAPLAFLGKDYDVSAEKLYTTWSTREIMTPKGPIYSLFSDSMTSNSPLRRIIEEIITEQVIEKVAKEHSLGRRLYVGTTNLDAQRLVVWNMGKIASIGTKESSDLFRKVILASTAIPVVFPPEFFDVTADGKHFEEMHVDGGVLNQMFFIDGVLDGFEKIAPKEGINPSRIKIKLYIIRNGYIKPIWQDVKSDISSISGRSMDTMYGAIGTGDIYKLYTFSQAKGRDFNLAYIPDQHKSVAKEMFDITEMKRLFDLGRKQALAGYPWKKKPPEMDSF